MSDQNAAQAGAGLLGHPLGRRLLFASLYLSEGAPIGFIWWALPVELRNHGVPAATIAKISSGLTLVWGFKFLWAPLIDVLRSPRWGRRHWIIVSQIGMGLALLPLMFLDLHDDLAVIIAILLVHALLATIQDAAIDSMAIANVSEHERGRINGWMQMGMLLGRGAFGGLSLWVASWIGQTGQVLALVVVIWWSTTLVIFGVPMESSERVDPDFGSRVTSFARAIGGAVRRRATWIGMAIALVAGASFEAAGGLAGSMLVDAGFSRERIGGFYALPVIVVTAAGALLGGFLSDRAGHRRIVILSLLATAPVAASAWWGVSATSGSWLSLAHLGLMYLGIGMLTASSYALLMDLTDRRIGATQFSAFMGATNLCESWVMWLAGAILSAGLGYTMALVIPAAVSLAAIPLVLSVRADSDRVS